MEEAKLSTEIGVPAGASFVADPETGAAMFRFVVDASNVIGPRRATKRDQAEYPGEWARFEAGRAKADQPLGTDRDGDGHKGGGLPDSSERAAHQHHKRHEPPTVKEPVRRKPGRPRKAKP